MKKSKLFTFLFVLSMFICVFGTSSISAKAQHEFTITDATSTSISFDWSNVANDWLKDKDTKKYHGKFRDFKIKISEYKESKRDYAKPIVHTVKSTQFHHTVKKLKAGKKYRIDISLYMDYKGGGGRVWGIWDEVYTARPTSYSMRIASVSDHSVFLEFADVINTLKSEATAAGGSRFWVSGVTYSYVPQTTDAATAIRQARKKALGMGQVYNNFNNNKTMYEIGGLNPSTAYAFSCMFAYDYFDKNGKIVYKKEYIEAGNVVTAPTPAPKPNPTPAPKPNPTPAPKPNPTPAPKPNPTPAPKPNPTPAPKPNPTPAPKPNPTPAPEQSQETQKQKEAAKVDNKAPRDNNSSVVALDKKNTLVAVDKDQLKASKLKKKKQSITMKVTKDEGKIKVKNVSSKKLRKYAKIKINNSKRKIKITFKKGAPKGKYKFNVAVGSKKKGTKSTETFEVIVK